MTTWDPDGGHEVLSYGRERPPRRPPPLLVGGLVGLVVGAVLGFVLGSRPMTSSDAAASEEDGRVPMVAAGEVRKLPGPAEAKRFGVTLFNTGGESVTVTVLALPGWAPRLTATRPTTIAPRSWVKVHFSTDVDCRTSPSTVRVVRVRVRSADGVTDRIVPLAEPADALTARHEHFCEDFGDGVSRWRW